MVCGILHSTRLFADVTLAPGIALRTDVSGMEIRYLQSVIRQLDRYARRSHEKRMKNMVTIVCNTGTVPIFSSSNILYLPGTAVQWMDDFALRCKIYGALASCRMDFPYPSGSSGIAPWMTLGIDAEISSAASAGQYLAANRGYPLWSQIMVQSSDVPDFSAMCRLGKTGNEVVDAFLAEQARALLHIAADIGDIKELFADACAGERVDKFALKISSSPAAEKQLREDFEKLVWNIYSPMPAENALKRLEEASSIWIQQVDDSGKFNGDHTLLKWRDIIAEMKKNRPDKEELLKRFSMNFFRLGRLLTADEKKICADISAAVAGLGSEGEYPGADFEKHLNRLRQRLKHRNAVELFFSSVLDRHFSIPDRFGKLVESIKISNDACSEREIRYLQKIMNDYLQ